MITMMDVYWITRLDSLIGLCIFLIIMFAVMIIALGVFSIVEDKWDKVKKSFYIFSSLLVFIIVICTFLPSTKEAVAIYMIPKIANNEQLQKLPDNALRLLNTKFEEWINSIDPKKGK